MSSFAIFPVAVGGGTLAICPLPGRGEAGRGGTYAADLGQMVAWRPALVISLTLASERRAHGADALPADLGAAGIGWRALPVADFGVPAPDAPWADVQSVAIGLLRDQGRVLIQCLGGCGRSGMAALRLMVATGEDPQSALARLRAARPCAVETTAQQVWACG